MKTTILLVCLLILAGCVSPAEVTRRNTVMAPTARPTAEQDRQKADSAEVVRQQTRQLYVQANPQLSPDVRTAVLAGRVLIGMRELDVVAAYALWRRIDYTDPKVIEATQPYRDLKPFPVWGIRDIHKTVVAGSVQEQWVLGRGFENDRYLYFEHGILTAVQE